MAFNKEQELAIEASIEQDLLIAAGAGSGKTKTLSERVFTLIDKGLIKPSELLVLTFTNNAAHEMKDRIIARFKSKPELAVQMLSSHVQTFDSFRQYLVKKYSSRLNISDNLHIVSQEVIETKKVSILEEILDEYYEDSTKRKQITETLIKFNVQDDRKTRQVILDLYEKLEKITPYSRLNYIESYHEKYLSKHFFDSVVSELVNRSKQAILDVIYDAIFEDKYQVVIDKADYNQLSNVFKNDELIRIDYKNYKFRNDNVVNPLYAKIVDLLDMEGEEFIKEASTFDEHYEDLLAAPTKKSGREIDADDAHSKPIFNRLRLLFCTKDSALHYLKDVDPKLSNEFEKLKYFEKDIDLLLEIVEKLNQRLFEYKRTTNSFTFSDVAFMALSLVKEDQFKDVAEEIRTSFKYIMIDEYQDTNDLQEDFIDSLTQINKKGTRSHVFCVGDAKQSIYGFMNSNVQLFRHRQDQYIDGKDGHDVIFMNKNYRSTQKIISDINYVCKNYMRLEHSDINYKDDNEQLHYDKEVDLYSEPFSNSGIRRIISSSGVSEDNTGNIKRWEAEAIANDIKNKVKDGFLVYDRSSNPHIRPCEYKDFVILTRVKSAFDLYQEVFNNHDIPLNNTSKVQLTKVNPIILLKSLVRLVSYKLGGEEVDVPHLFASVARSYVYRYDDEDLLKIIYPAKSGDLSLIENDQISRDLDGFIERNRGNSFNSIFLNLIEDFRVIKDLYFLDKVEDNIAKIESLYQIIRSQEEAGEGLKEFVQFFEDLESHDLDLESETVQYNSNAVDLMTIFASKGLENKIVYCPNSYNKLTSGSNRTKPDYLYTKKYGILLPYYNFGYDNIDELGVIQPVHTKLLPHLVNNLSTEEEDEVINEHARIFYVALTRAENLFYIVGDAPNDGKELNKCANDEDMYGMMLSCPHYYQFNGELIDYLLKNGVVLKEFIDKYNDLVEHIKAVDRPLNKFDYSKQEFKSYIELWNARYRSYLIDSMLDKVETIERQMFNHFHSLFIAKNSSHSNYCTELYKYYLKKTHDAYSVDDIGDINEFKDKVQAFKDALTELDLSYFGKTSKKKDEIPYELVNLLNRAFVYVSLGIKCHKKLSFTTSEFDDACEIFDYRLVASDQQEKKLKLTTLKISNEEIEFEERISKRASKEKPFVPDEDLQKVFEFGTKLHRLFELTDLVTKNTSFIKDKKEKFLIDRALTNDVFKNLNEATIYKEFGYFDELLGTTGFIDLLIKRDDKFVVVDYKTKHTGDDAYKTQLKTYKRNVCSIFNVKEENVECYLLSIVDNKLIKLE